MGENQAMKRKWHLLGPALLAAMTGLALAFHGAARIHLAPRFAQTMFPGYFSRADIAAYCDERRSLAMGIVIWGLLLFLAGGIVAILAGRKRPVEQPGPE